MCIRDSGIAFLVAEIRAEMLIEIVDACLRLDAITPGMVEADVVVSLVKIVFIFNVADDLFEYCLLYTSRCV